jgi:hypothetical protein
MERPSNEELTRMCAGIPSLLGILTDTNRMDSWEGVLNVLQQCQDTAKTSADDEFGQECIFQRVHIACPELKCLLEKYVDGLPYLEEKQKNQLKKKVQRA